MAILGRSSANVLGVSNRFSAVLLRATLLVCVFGLSTAFAFARIYEAPHSGLTWVRVAVSLASIAIVVFARRRDIARSVALAFALETAAGIAIFAYVDVPFVTSHDTQIADRVAAAYTVVTHRGIENDLRGFTRMR